MFTVVANAEQLRNALKEIERAELNGRGQRVTERHKFVDGKLIPIK